VRSALKKAARCDRLDYVLAEWDVKLNNSKLAMKMDGSEKNVQAGLSVGLQLDILISVFTLNMLKYYAAEAALYPGSRPRRDSFRPMPTAAQTLIATFLRQTLIPTFRAPVKIIPGKPPDGTAFVRCPPWPRH